MIPVKQKFHHRPRDGVWGDCYRAAIACVLNMRVEDVPHFFEGGVSSREADEHADFWLRRRGIIPFVTVYPGELDLDLILRSIAHYNPDIAFLLTGESRTGVGHTVVCARGRIVCDPSLTDAGIVGPIEGYYWVTVFGAAVAHV